MHETTGRKLKKIAKMSTCVPVLFGLAFAAFAWKFSGLFQEGVLPGWDTLPHQYLLKVMAERLLPDLTASGYDLGWFGGFPAFQFHPPLAFILASLPHLLSFKAISVFLSFRIFLFLCLPFFSVSLYYFVREFFRKEAAKASIFFGLLFVFYPKGLAEVGCGAAASIYEGLFVVVFAVSILLWYFTFLERLRKKPTKRNFFLASAALAALFLTHAISSIAAGIFFIVYLAANRKKRVGRQAALSGLLAVLLAAFWIIPFLSNLEYSSAGRISSVRGAFLTNLYTLFPFNLRTLASTEFLKFNFLGLFAAAFFLPGFIRLMKKKASFLPISLSILFFFFLTDYLFYSLPDITLYYFRFLPFAFIAMLAIASYGFSETFAKTGKKWKKILLAALAAAFSVHAVISYNLSTSSGESGDLILGKYSGIHYEYSLPYYPEAENARETADFFKKRERDGRIFTETPLQLLAEAGSPHYFTGLLAMEGTDMTNGFWVKDGLQIAFLAEATKKYEILWGGYDPLLLRIDPLFRHQPEKFTFDRLKIFGTRYVIAYSDKLKIDLAKHGGARFLDSFGNFSIYELKNARPPVYRSGYAPGIFIDKGGQTNFREFASVWYQFPETLDFPVAESLRGLDEIKEEELEKFSLVIISAGKIRNEEVSRINAIAESHRTVILSDKYESAEGLDKKIVIVSDLEGRNFSQKSHSLKTTVLQAMRENILKPEKIGTSEFSPDKISFSGEGPMIINASYFPYWKESKGKDVYQVTPGQMLVFADDETILKYVPGWDKKAGIAVSLLALLGTFFWILKRKPEKRKDKGQALHPDYARNLFVIIPVFNEKASIEKILKEVLSAKTPGYGKKTIVVDDGSDDGTEKILDKMAENGEFTLLRHPENRGKGAAIRTAMKKVGRGIVLIQDADMEYDPNDYAKMLQAYDPKKTPIVYGSRNLRRKTRGYFFYFMGGKIDTALLNLLFGSNLTDMHTCYKLIRSDIIRGIKLESDGFDFCPEITAKLLKSGYRIKEVPIKYRPRKFSEGKKIRLSDGLHSFFWIIRIFCKNDKKYQRKSQ